MSTWLLKALGVGDHLGRLYRMVATNSDQILTLTEVVTELNRQTQEIAAENERLRMIVKDALSMVRAKHEQY